MIKDIDTSNYLHRVMTPEWLELRSNGQLAYASGSELVIQMIYYMYMGAKYHHSNLWSPSKFWSSKIWSTRSQDIHQAKNTFWFSELPTLISLKDYLVYPLGFWLCQFHESRHMSSRESSVFQPSSFSALVVSAQNAAKSPCRLLFEKALPSTTKLASLTALP